MFNALFDALNVRPVISNVANVSDGMTTLSDAMTLISTDHATTITGIESVAAKFKTVHDDITAAIGKSACCADVTVSKTV